MSSKQAQAQARDLKHRVLTCLHKLSDRDTHAAAASELESIARNLSTDALPSFISSISATDSSDKSPVRRQCVRLVAVLSDHHGNSLSPHLSKVLSAVVRRLRDPDSSVRAACVAASLSLAAHLTAPPFASITKPFLEPLFVEQEANTQNGVALCLAAVIEGSANPDVAGLRKLLPRLEKLAKCDSFKAKAAVLALVGSIVAVEGVLSGGGKNLVKNLIACLTEFLSSDDWAARKAAAEALMKMAAVEKHALSEYKASCLKTFEAKRFDKVKAARETMNQMVEAWKEITDPTDEISPSSKEIGSDVRYTHVSKTSTSPQVKRISPLDEQSSRASLPNVTPASAARRRSSIGVNGNKTSPSPPIFRKLDSKKPSNVKLDVAESSSVTSVSQDNGRSLNEGKQFENLQIKRALFDDNNEKQNLVHESSVIVSNEIGEICRNERDCEELSLIRKQLVQIETQQSNLLDILQRFIGSSQRGIHSLEARVHGLELALDEISFDLAVSTGRMSRDDGAGARCCSLPGAEFLNLKLRRKTESRPTASVAAAGRLLGKNEGDGGFPLQNRRRGGLIMNPLAEIPLPKVSSNGAANTIVV